MPLITGIVLVAFLVCLSLVGIYLQWRSRQIYKRIGNYSIGLATFYGQLEYPGLNFPGPNVLEAEIAAQPAGLQAYVQVHRRRLRHLRWAVLSYIGLLLVVGLVFSLARN